MKKINTGQYCDFQCLVVITPTTTALTSLVSLSPDNEVHWIYKYHTCFNCAALDLQRGFSAHKSRGALCAVCHDLLAVQCACAQCLRLHHHNYCNKYVIKLFISNNAVRVLPVLVMNDRTIAARIPPFSSERFSLGSTGTGMHLDWTHATASVGIRNVIHRSMFQMRGIVSF